MLRLEFRPRGGGELPPDLLCMLPPFDPVHYLGSSMAVCHEPVTAPGTLARLLGVPMPEESPQKAGVLPQRHSAPRQGLSADPQICLIKGVISIKLPLVGS